MGWFDGDDSDSDHDNNNDNNTRNNKRKLVLISAESLLTNSEEPSVLDAHTHTHTNAGASASTAKAVDSADVDSKAFDINDGIEDSEGNRSKKDEEQQEEEDIDPLDAFMKDLVPKSSLSSIGTGDYKYAQKQQNEKEIPIDRNDNKTVLRPVEATTHEGSGNDASDTIKNHGRLDWDNEDEATGHWQQEESFSKSKSNATHIHTATNTTTTTTSQSRLLGSSNSIPVLWYETTTDNNGGSSNNSKTDADAWRDMHNIVVRLEDRFQKRNHSHNYHQNQHHHNFTIPDPIYHLEELQCLDTFTTTTNSSISSSGTTSTTNKLSCVLHQIRQNYTEPTAVQAQALPLALQGHDLLITAATGQGKTLAYLWPLVLYINHYHYSDENSNTATTTMANTNNTNTNKKLKGPLALVLVPTRELALQVHQHAKPLLQAMGGHSKVIVSSNGGGGNNSTGGGGGGSTHQLQQDLRRKTPDLVVATPGRLLDLMQHRQSRDLFSWRHCHHVVLDEADHMLQMGFRHQVTTILQALPVMKQSILVSATLTSSTQQFCNSIVFAPRQQQQQRQQHTSAASVVRLQVGQTNQATDHVLQHFIVLLPTNHDHHKQQNHHNHMNQQQHEGSSSSSFVNYNAKFDFLRQMLPIWSAVGRTLIFVRTKQACQDLEQQVQTTLKEQQQQQEQHDTTTTTTTTTTATTASSSSLNVKVAMLHGDMHPMDRHAALVAFRQKTITVLIATDVASRGLDVPQVATVVNYDTAKNTTVHVHRIGRAGRLNNNNNNNNNNDKKDSNDTQQGQQHEHEQGSAYTLLTLSDRQDVDFCSSLMTALQRQGKEVPPELVQVARSGSKNHNRHPQHGRRFKNSHHKPSSTGFVAPPNTGQREHWNKAGLGFDRRDTSFLEGTQQQTEERNTKQQHDTQQVNLIQANLPTKKQRRWGPETS